MIFMSSGQVSIDLRRIFKAAAVVVAVLLIGGVGLFWVYNDKAILIFPEVWSQYSPYGASYEFKVNDAQLDPNAELESGFLSTVDRVIVTDTRGIEFELDRDFNINEYSGEVTRRFVLYGPEEAELPETGKYRFDYIKNGKIVLTQYVDYTQSNLGYPTNVSWERKGNDIFVQWTPPLNVNKKNWYKVLIWNTDGTPEAFVSLKFDGDVSYGLLENVPLVENGEYQLNVAVFSGVGYAYSHYYYFSWDENATPIIR